MAKVLMDPLPSLRSFRPDVPEGLEAVIARCLEKDPNARFANVAELSRALTPYAPQRSVLAVERVHRILGSVPPPAMTSSTPPAGSRTPSLPSVEGPSLARTPGPGQSFAAGSTSDGEAAGKRTTLGWGSDGKKGAGGGRQLVVALAGVAALLAIGGFFLLRPNGPAPEASPASGAPGVVSAAVTVATPAPPPEPVAAPPTVAPVAEPVGAASPEASVSAPPAAAPKAPGPSRPRAEAPATKSAPAPAPAAPKSKDSRLHMELKK
jgi:serine/threonine-protein kinase